jgi:photosystem II stability/assembly factor-like uncharacterized protein
MNAFLPRIVSAVVLALAFELPLPAGPQVPTINAYTWHNVAIGGGGFVTAIIFHPAEKDLLYARTDVGGAYRWDKAGKRWIPITDWIGPEDGNLTGIESLALDPRDSNRVYLAAGTYSSGHAAILRSEDRGRTFQRTDVPFTMGGNEIGRFNGERLAVDPNRGEILFFGSRHHGLWKSDNRGAAWNKVEGFPDIGTATNSGFGESQQSPGIICVVFDAPSGKPGSPTPVLYAAVSTTGTNLFCSKDAGVRWDAVSGQPRGLRPNHVAPAPGGIFYLSYGKEPGPNTMSDGAIWKFDSKTGAWTDVTPVKPGASDQPFGYGAIAIDAQHPSTIMVTTFAHWHPHDEIFRSTNGGASWTQLWQDDTQWDHSSAPYTSTRTPHWMGDIKINPFNPDQVLFTTGYGIWGCVDATQADHGRPTHWVFWNSGLEETVPLALISPPEGAHLLSGVGDVDGFRHDDLEVSPPGGSYAGPRFGNTEALAFASKKPQFIVRTGTSRTRGLSRGAYSDDGGRNWTAFAAEPPRSAGAGSIAVAADGTTIVWTPRRSAAWFSADKGKTWTTCGGLVAGVRVVADSVDPSRFYAYQARERKLCVSTNGGVSFIAASATFSNEQGFGGDSVTLLAGPDREGDLWLAFRDGGLFHSTNGGGSFTKLESVQRAHSLGFGKPASGKEDPTLFLAGRINELTALFRSDDSGRTWTRINDEQHQFGWVNHVTGDPRIYGRIYFATGGRGIIYGDLGRPR